MSPVHDVTMVSVDSIREICSLIGLIAALVYTVMTALPTATSWDEYEITDWHFQSVTAEDWTTHKDTLQWSSDEGRSMQSSAGTGIAVGKYGCQIKLDKDVQPYGNARQLTDCSLFRCICQTHTHTHTHTHARAHHVM